MADSASAEVTETTEDAALGGRLRLRQPRRGHRFGHDGVLLGASVPARPGDVVVDLGAGVGLAGLAVAARVPGISLTLVERDPALADLATANARANAIPARAVCADVVGLGGTEGRAAGRAAGLPLGGAQHVLMNPPFNDQRRFNASPDAARQAAHAAAPDLLAAWTAIARSLLAPGGTLTLIWRAEDLAGVLAALSPGFGGVTLLPVHPRPGAGAIRILAGVVKGSRAPLRLLPGLVLTGADGHPSVEAEAVLRGGAATALGRADAA